MDFIVNNQRTNPSSTIPSPKEGINLTQKRPKKSRRYYQTSIEPRSSVVDQEIPLPIFEETNSVLHGEPPFGLLPHDFIRAINKSRFSSGKIPLHIGNMNPVESATPAMPHYLFFEYFDDTWEELEQSHRWTQQAQLCFKMRGSLRTTQDGFVYLKLSDEWIDNFFFLFQDNPSVEKAHNPYSIHDLGAHIGVISPSESKRKNIIHQLNEIGKIYTFQVTGLFSFNPHGLSGIGTVWAFTVDSPDLEQIRMNYGLSLKPTQKGFLLPLAYKKTKGNLNKLSYLRISPNSSPA